MSLGIQPLAFDKGSVVFPHLEELHLPQAWGPWGGVHGEETTCGQGSAQAGSPLLHRDPRRCSLGWEGLLLLHL